MKPVLPVDLTVARANGGKAFADMANWDEDVDPVVGQHVIAADGGSERLPAVITEVRPDGVLVLHIESATPATPANASTQPDPDPVFVEPWRYTDAHGGWVLHRSYPHYRVFGRVRTGDSRPVFAAVWFDPHGTNLPPGRHRSDLGVEVHTRAATAAEAVQWVADIIALGEQLSQGGMAAWLAAGGAEHSSTEAVLQGMVATDAGEFRVQIVAASHAGDKRIHLTLDNGVAKTVDVQALLWGPAFATIAADDQAFAELYFDPDAGTVCWPGALDLSPETLIALPDVGEQVSYDDLDHTNDDRLTQLLTDTLPELLSRWEDFRQAETVVDAAFTLSALANAVTHVMWDYQGFDDDNPQRLAPEMFAPEPATTAQRIADAAAMAARDTEANELRRIRKIAAELLKDDE